MFHFFKFLVGLGLIDPIVEDLQGICFDALPTSPDASGDNGDALDHWLGLLAYAKIGGLQPSRRVAFHEASHAVIGLAFGMPVGVIVVDKDQGFALCSHGGQPAASQNVLWLAGPLGEAIGTGDHYRPFDWHLREEIAASHDPHNRTDRPRTIRNLRTALENVCEAELIAAYRDAEVQTLDLLSQQPIRDAITAVANELLRIGGYLPGDDVLAITSQFFEPGEFSKGEIE